MNSLTVTPLFGPFGVHVDGINWSGPLPEDVAGELADLLDKHSLLLFRGSEISAEAQMRVLQAFGPLCDEAGHGRYWTTISNIDVERPDLFRTSRLLFHQDYAWSPLVSPCLSLYAEELSGPGAATVFASNHLGYLRLSDDQRRAMSAQEIVQAYEPQKSGDEARRNKIPDPDDPAEVARFRWTQQPMISPHPRTSLNLLCVTELLSSHIAGLGPDDSENLISEARRVLYEPGCLYTHDWRPHDLVIWDNLVLQHARGPVPEGSRRTLRRVMVNSHTLDEVFAAAN